MLAQNERESVGSEVSSNSGRELAQITCRKEANLLIGQRSRRRKQTKLPHHSNIVPIRKVLCDLGVTNHFIAPKRELGARAASHFKTRKAQFRHMQV